MVQSLLHMCLCIHIYIYKNTHVYGCVYIRSHRSLQENRGISWSGNLAIKSHAWFPRTSDSMEIDRKFWQPDNDKLYTINEVVFFSRSWGRNCETKFW